MKTITYTCLITMRTNALWAAEMWFAMGENFQTTGAYERAVRYWKIAKRIEDAMWRYSASNLVKGGVV